jgi:hypothetical protein
VWLDTEENGWNKKIDGLLASSHAKVFFGWALVRLCVQNVHTIHFLQYDRLENIYSLNTITLAGVDWSLL